eukprot:scaffold8276_cov62-Phaeocystis_antarctica.AAC.5
MDVDPFLLASGRAERGGAVSQLPLSHHRLKPLNFPKRLTVRPQPGAHKLPRLVRHRLPLQRGHARRQGRALRAVEVCDHRRRTARAFHLRRAGSALCRALCRGGRRLASEQGVGEHAPLAPLGGAA